MRKTLAALLFVVLVSGCSDKREQGPDVPTPAAGPELKLLFLGNSYTYVNDLPQMLAQLAKWGGHPMTTEMAAPGGWTLADHANSKDSLGKIAEKKWDYVVLQEQSIVPSVAEERTQYMYPAVRYLADQIRQAGSQPLLYQTWGRQKGLPEKGYPDYDSMQAQLTQAYTEIGREVDSRIAPAGEAWKAALKLDPSLNLWQGDGSHPTGAGTYLTACVFYAVLYRQSPEGLGFWGGLSGGTAHILQKVAQETVLKEPAQWNIR